MTDKKSFAYKVRDHPTTDTHHAHPAPERRSWAAAIMHRWPTWLAIALAALTVGVAPWRALRTSFPCWRSSIWPLPSCSDARPRGSWPSPPSRRSPL